MININVEVNNKTWLKKIKNSKKYFNQRLKKISPIIKFSKGKNIFFTILLTNSLNMKKLNKKFRKCNKATDVLSFPSFLPKKLKLVKEKEVYIGDVAVSYEIINFRSKDSKKIKNPKNFLGGKGANLSEMGRMGLPGPRGKLSRPGWDRLARHG